MRPIFTPVPVPHDEWKAPRSYSLMLYREQGIHAPGTGSVSSKSVPELIGMC